MRFLPLALIPALLLAGGAFGQTKLGADGAQVATDNNAFACDLYQQLAQKDGNLFFSPYSISTALGMTYAGAKGDTAAEMAKTMHFGLDAARLHPAFAALIKETDAKGRKYKLQVANRLWGQKNYGFMPDFLKTTEHNYGAGLKEVDFINATEDARKLINAWVEEQTQDKIKDLLRPGVLSSDTRLVLTNAIYFKAAWMHPFEPKNTKDGDFTLTNGKTAKAKFLADNFKAPLANLEDCQVLELPYEHHDLSMVIVLPKKADGLAAVEKNLNAAFLAKAKAALVNSQVDIKLPKFKVTAEFQLNDQLARLGMKLAFVPGEADFSGMTTREKLFISAVIHKAFVDVNEAGTEAAAATAVVMNATSAVIQPPPPGTFHATRPFLYTIRDNRTGSILFVGRVADPSVQ